MSTMFIHETQIVRLTMAVGCTFWLLATSATAMPIVFRDHTAAEKFFEAGDQQIEREIKLLNQLHSKGSAKILGIDEQTQFNVKELENLDSVYPQPQLQKSQRNTD